MVEGLGYFIRSYVGVFLDICAVLSSPGWFHAYCHDTNEIQIKALRVLFIGECHL